MVRHLKKKSHARDVGPPAIRLLAVNTHREEDQNRVSGMGIDEAKNLKPKGGFSADTPMLKTRNEFLKIGTWNVRTLFQAGKLDNLVQEFDSLKLDILGIAETHWTESGIIQKEEHTIIYSGGEEHRRGVGIMLNRKTANCLMGYWPISERTLLCKIQARPFNLAIIQCYAPTADQTQETLDEFYSEIEMAIKQTKSDDIVFVLGDFNAKVGNAGTSHCVGQFGLGKTNERGDTLIDFCEQHNLSIVNTFFKHPKRHLYTWKSPGDVTRNQIDYILIKDRFKNSVKRCKAYPGADIGSDHNPVVANIKIKLKIPRKSDHKPGVDITALRQPEIKEEFALKVKNKFERLMAEGCEQTPENLEGDKSEWECLKQAITDVQGELLPPKKKEARQHWMTQEILDLMETRKAKKGTGEYQNIDKLIRNKCREAKENWANKKCQRIEMLSYKNQTREMFNEIKQIQPMKNNISGCIKDKNGAILFEADKIIERWKEYIEDLFQDERSENPIKNFLGGPDITRHEIEATLRQMKKGKAVGVDNISTEALQALGEFGIEKLTNICNEMYKSAQIPEDLRTSIFIVLPKKQKATDCSDHRTISLMCHTLKLLLLIILKRITNKIDSNVGPEQTGFRKNSGTREGIFNLRILTEKYIEREKDIFACFIDYSKAFDTVKHHELVQCLQTTDIEENDLAVIANLYWQQTTKVRLKNEVSDSLKIQRGDRQGCVLSPALFNLYTDIIFRKIDQMPGLKIGGHNINNLRYADDTVLLAESETELQQILDTVKDESQKYGLLMNAKKTKSMVFSKKKDTPKIEIKIDGKTVEQVKSFQYLGALVTEDGRSVCELERRIIIAKRRFVSMSKLFTNHDLSLPTKIRLTQCFIWSTLLYGCETWSLTPTMELKLRGCEMWIYRRIGRVSWKEKRTNQEVLKKLGLKGTKLMSMVQQRIVRFYGHVRRHDTLQRVITEGMVEGKRGRGRKRVNWLGNVAEYTKKAINVCAEMALDRNKWRTVVSNVVSDREQR